MVSEAKNDWYQQQAQLVEKGVTGGGSMHVVWQSLRNIRQGRAGLQPVRPKSVHELMDNCVVGLLRHWGDGVSTFSLF